MSDAELRHGSATHVGLVRKVNEDALLASPPIFLVADGMGGHQGGDVASSIVVDEFSRLGTPRGDAPAGVASVVGALSQSQSRIRSWGETQGDPATWRAGTTVTVAILVHESDGPRWLLANLGDSRIYRLRQGALEQVSVDHSVVQELVDAGRITAEEALTHPERHVITRALGTQDGVEPDFFLLPVVAGERLLLCSDGISGMVPDAGIREILHSCPDPEAAAQALVAAALEGGGRDNATAVVVDVVGLITDDTYDSVQTGTGFDTIKLGALP